MHVGIDNNKWTDVRALNAVEESEYFEGGMSISADQDGFIQLARYDIEIIWSTVIH